MLKAKLINSNIRLNHCQARNSLTEYYTIDKFDKANINVLRIN